MTVTVRDKADLVVPRSVRRRAGIKAGDRLEFKVSGGVITVVPQLPSADDEYTPEQRRIIDAQIAEGLADVKKGRVHGPFRSHQEMIRFLHDRATGKRSSRDRR